MKYALTVHSIIMEPQGAWARLLIHPTFNPDSAEKPYLLELRGDQALPLLDWMIQTGEERAK